MVCLKKKRASFQRIDGVSRKTSIVFWVSVCGVFWAMVGYPLFLTILSKFVKKKNTKDYDLTPSVTVMVVAHNEEKVIEEKLNNILALDYPEDKIDYIIASDNCTDGTDAIVERFIVEHPEKRITIHKTTVHNGKTNAQNEAQKLVHSEILVMTDANAMLEKNSVRELAASFTDPDIAYVSGQLIYKNASDNSTAGSEGIYWKMDLRMREIESDIQTITAGNGALYACRNSLYHDFDLIKCHDSAMPLYFAMHGKRAVYNKDAIAYEKAGENNGDEFKRKIRMNRSILSELLPTVNVFKYKWFPVFYFGHRTCRYLLWLFHALAFVSSIFLMVLKGGIWWIFTSLVQSVSFILGLLSTRYVITNRYLRLVGYYMMTIFAQLVGVKNVVTGRSRPTWDKAESTR